jgi:hypothetical protein
VDDFQSPVGEDFTNDTGLDTATGADDGHRANGRVVRDFFHSPEYTERGVISQRDVGTRPAVRGITACATACAMACAKLAVMEKRVRLRVMKWLGPTPAIAVCEGCNQEFKVPLTVLAKTAAAQAYLQEQFQRHKCEIRASGKDANRSG